MTPKRISVTENVYNLLKRVQLRGESYGDTIARLCRTKTSVALHLWAESSDGWNDLTVTESAKLESALRAIQGDFHLE